MKKFIVSIFILIITSCNLFAFSFNVDQPGIHIATNDGDSTDGVIFVENTSDKATEFTVSVMDWTINDKSKKLFYPSGTLKDSCASWINVSPRNFKLDPGKKQEVKYVLTTPVGAAAGHYAVVFFETISKKDGSSEVSLAGRIGTIIYHSVSGTEIVKSSVSNFAVKSFDKGLFLNFEMKNDGNVYTIVNPSVAVLDANGKVVKRAKLSKFGVMPGVPAKRSEKIDMNLPQGKYKILLTTEYGSYYKKDLYNLNESSFEISDVSDLKESVAVDSVEFEKVTLIGQKTFAKFFVKVANNNKDFKNVNCAARVYDRKGNQIKSVALASNVSMSPNSMKLFYHKIDGDFTQSMYKVLITISVDGRNKEIVRYLSVK